MTPTTTDRLTTALRPRHPETRTLVEAAAGRLATQLDGEVFDQIVEAVEHPAGVGTVEVARLAGISQRQIDEWTRHGWLSAEADGIGHGYPRRYLPDQLLKARLMGQMVKLWGMTPVTAAQAAEQLAVSGRARVPGFELVRRTR